MKLFVIVLTLVLLSGCQSNKVDGAHLSTLLKIEALSGRAEKAYKNNKIEEAQALFQEVIKLDPEDQQALYRLGNIAFRKGNLKESAQYFTKVVALNPKNSKAHYNLGTIHLMYAEEHMKFFTATAPRDFDLNAVSTLLGQLDQFSKGNRAQSKAASVEPDAESNESLDRLVNLIEKD